MRWRSEACRCHMSSAPCIIVSSFVSFGLSSLRDALALGSVQASYELGTLHYLGFHDEATGDTVVEMNEREASHQPSARDLSIPSEAPAKKSPPAAQLRLEPPACEL